MNAAVLGALAAAGAVLVASAPVAEARGRLADVAAPPGAAATTPWRATRSRLLAIACAAALLVSAGHAATAVGVVVVACGGEVAVRLAQRRRRDRRAAATRARVVELCETLGAELAAGGTAPGALARAADDWPALGPTARAAAVGGDPVAELRRLSRDDGAEALQVVAAAWLVAARTGHGLGDTLARVGDDLRAADRTRRVVTGELASARATARLLAGLPVLALAMGASTGADPLAFLLATPLGALCLAGGVVLTFAGLAWIDALARGVDGAGSGGARS